MLFTNSDLPVLTIVALNVTYRDLVAELDDYHGVHGEQLHARRQQVMGELHQRAKWEDIARVLPDAELQATLDLFSAIPWSPRTVFVPSMCAVLRSEQARRSITIDGLDNPAQLAS